MKIYEIVFDENSYRIRVAPAGIFLESFESEKEWRILRKLPSVETKYRLIYALLDGLINRSLAYNFPEDNLSFFIKDKYAAHLRIALSVLVPYLSIDHLPESSCLRGAVEPVYKFTIDKFNLLKQYLDQFGSKQGKLENKYQLLSIEEDEFFELTEYISDTDSEAELTCPLEVNGENDSLEEIRRQAGYERFIKYLEGRLKNCPKKIYKIPSIALPENVIKFANHFLVRKARSDLIEYDVFDSEGKILDVDGNLLFSKPIFIPGFRGINHMPGRFSDEVRRLLRKSEIQLAKRETAYFSEAVLKGHLDFYQDVELLKQTYEKDSEVYARLLETGEELCKQLLRIQQVEHILAHGLSEGGGKDKRLFGNLLDVLQHIYTNGIISFQRMLAQMREDLKIDFHLPNAYNPFISESEAPYHAYRYALGMKNPYEPGALKPRYRNDGRPSYPYLGEIQITLRRLDSLTILSRRRSLVREKQQYGALSAATVIAPELEATALGYLPEEEVVYSEVVRCPNFSDEYNVEFDQRYGFTPKIFALFKERIIANAKNRLEYETVLEDLFEWLCCYHTARLVKKATELAIEKKGQLAFLDQNHGISCDVPDRVMDDEKRQSWRKKIGAELYKKRDGRKKGAILPTIKVQLTTHKQSFFNITEEEIRQAGRAIGLKKEEIEELLFIDDILRTPPTKRTCPRTPLSADSQKVKKESPYRLGFTPSPSTKDGSNYPRATTLLKSRRNNEEDISLYRLDSTSSSTTEVGSSYPRSATPLGSRSNNEDYTSFFEKDFEADPLFSVTEDFQKMGLQEDSLHTSCVSSSLPLPLNDTEDDNPLSPPSCVTDDFQKLGRLLGKFFSLYLEKCYGKNGKKEEKEHRAYDVKRKKNDGLNLFIPAEDYGGGGDCLFKSVAAFTPEGSHLGIRNLLVEQGIERHRDMLAALFQQEGIDIQLRTVDGIEHMVNDIDQYLHFMKQQGTWAGYLELAVLAPLLQRPIVLLMAGAVPQVFWSQEEENTQNQEDPIFLFYNGEDHYKPLLTIQDSSKTRQEIFTELAQLSQETEYRTNYIHSNEESFDSSVQALNEGNKSSLVNRFAAKDEEFEHKLVYSSNEDSSKALSI
ncbi:MAG: hypothetical protein K0R24_438 [Gammaproteobacteria bacterium]|jgi:hypothetical protein|nr:hypothetical protein [Gammaproteobacteria bacterium]